MPDSPLPARSPEADATWWERAWEAGAPGADPPPLTRWQTTWRILFVLLLGYGVLLTTLADWTGEIAPWRWGLAGADVLAGIAGVWIYQKRRAYPVAAAAALAVLGTVFLTVSGAALLAFASLAARRHLRGVALLILISLPGSVVLERIWPTQSPFGFWTNIIVSLGIMVVVAAVAYAIGARRATRQALVERAEANEREQAARVAQAQAAERTRIAREMHDVLAHRISLVAMHASALNYRQDLSEDDRRTATETIERNAREALTELREVLGVLRDPSMADAAGAHAAGGVDADGEQRIRPEKPQPTLRDLPALAEEARTLGTAVEIIGRAGEVPERIGRAAYRIVQESLTNARKHAPESPVTVQINDAGGTLLVRVSQPEQEESATPPPGSGMGLLGLRERAVLVGGTLEAGLVEGEWVVEARLPLSGSA